MTIKTEIEWFDAKFCLPSDNVYTVLIRYNNGCCEIISEGCYEYEKRMFFIMSITGEYCSIDMPDVTHWAKKPLDEDFDVN